MIHHVDLEIDPDLVRTMRRHVACEGDLHAHDVNRPLHFHGGGIQFLHLGLAAVRFNGFGDDFFGLGIVGPGRAGEREYQSTRDGSHTRPTHCSLLAG